MLPVGEDDPWLAVDKLEHVLFCAFVSGGAYVAALYLRKRRWRIIFGAFAGLCAGLLKELGDELGFWPGRASLRDFGADLMGIALGLWAMAATEPHLHKRGDKAGDVDSPLVETHL
jgi:VanZ family protein